MTAVLARMPTRLLLPLLLAVAACGSSVGEPRPLPLGEEVTLAPGETAGSDVRLVFERVASDSRCPIDALCIWEGDALVVATLRAVGAECAVELHTAGSLPHEGTCAGYGVRLSRLTPAPRAASPVPASAYRATFVVTRAA